MRHTTRATLAGIAAAAIAFSISACSGARPDPKPAPPAPAAGASNPGTQPGNSSPAAATVTEITEAEAPEQLREWAREKQMEESPAYFSLVTNNETFVGVAAGLKPTGGYQVGLRRSFVTTVNGHESLQLDVGVSPPSPGSVTTSAMTNPMAFYRVSGTPPIAFNFVGESLVDPVSPDQPDTVNVGFTAGLKLFLVVTGTTPLPRVHVAVQNGEQVLAEKNVDVVNGRYAIAMGTASEFPTGADVVVSEAEGTKPLHTVPVPQEPLAEGPAWSENFHRVTARQLDATTVLVEGAARAFEAMFKVQIRSGGQVIASQPVMAAEGGPAYGAFSERITTSAPMPHDGVEAWFIIPSAKDGSEVAELITPVLWGK